MDEERRPDSSRWGWYRTSQNAPATGATPRGVRPEFHGDREKRIAVRIGLSILLVVLALVFVGSNVYAGVLCIDREDCPEESGLLVMAAVVFVVVEVVLAFIWANRDSTSLVGPIVFIVVGVAFGVVLGRAELSAAVAVVALTAAIGGAWLASRLWWRR